MGVGVLDHFNIRTRKLGETVRFYQDVLGLEKPGRFRVAPCGRSSSTTRTV
jgi:hypothetical protein